MNDFTWRDISSSGNAVEVSGELTLLTTDDYLHPALPAFAAAQTGAWMLARTTGAEVWLGPVFRGKEIRCWFCLAAWLRMRRWRETAQSGWGDFACPRQPDHSGTAESRAMALEAAFANARYLAKAGRLSDLEGAVVRLDGKGNRMQRVPVPRRPECDCGDEPGTPPGLGYWTNPVTGIIHQLGVTNAPVGGFFHARAFHYAPVPTRNRLDLIQPGVAFGRGLTQTEAEQSCIAEGLERYSAIWQGHEPERIGAQKDIPGAIDPQTVLQFSPLQYQSRPAFSPTIPAAELVPRPLKPEEPIPWTRVQSLTNGSEAWLPAEFCYMWRRTRGEPIALPDSNGCAAGRTMEEAQKSALLELIERDAVAIWWANQIEHAGIPWESFQDSQLAAAVASLRDEGIHTHLLDLTTDLGVPVYAAIGADSSGGNLCFGMAAAETGIRAAWRALGELSQIWLWIPPGDNDGEFSRWQNAHNLASASFLRPHRESQPRDVPAMTAASLAAYLESHGLQPYWLDLTRPEIGLPVCRVVVPGLRHFWKRYAPGRLYDVPARMGWLPQAKREDELQTWSCPI